jgi:hypothetical protein
MRGLSTPPVNAVGSPRALSPTHARLQTLLRRTARSSGGWGSIPTARVVFSFLPPKNISLPAGCISTHGGGHGLLSPQSTRLRRPSPPLRVHLSLPLARTLDRDQRRGRRRSRLRRLQPGARSAERPPAGGATSSAASSRGWSSLQPSPQPPSSTAPHWRQQGGAEFVGIRFVSASPDLLT